MKKIFLAALTAVLTLNASAQNNVTFGIRAGLNIANITTSGSQTNASINLGSRVGFHIGAIADIPVAENFYIQPGLFFSQKGFSTDATNQSSAEGKPLYLEVPVLASYRIKASDEVNISLEAGPYLAYGIGGSGTLSSGNQTASGDYFDDDTNRFDAGLKIGAGVTFSQHYYVGMAYEWGFVNLLKDYDNISLKNKNLMISLGHNF